ncbi:MAG: response regulator [Chloroflexi bacterium]|nr:response regulator [Chloroflexota bacterium]
MASRILCIEDEPEMIDLIRLILTRAGYEVLGAESGPVALSMLEHEDVDLILLDLMMPEMDGWEVYQRLKAWDRTRNIPVIIVTAKAQRIDRVLGLYIVGVDDYITKPFSPKTLLHSVEKILAKQKEMEAGAENDSPAEETAPSAEATPPNQNTDAPHTPDFPENEG